MPWSVMKMIVTMNEKKRAEELINIGNLSQSPVYDASLVYRYYYFEDGLRGKELSNKVVDFFYLLYPRWTKAHWCDIVDTISNKKQKPLCEIDYIDVTDRELDVISKLNGRVVKEIAFTLLCLAKLGNIKSDTNNNWANSDPKDVFNLAGVSATVSRQQEVYRELVVSGYITMSNKITNLNVQVNGIVDGDVAMRLTSFKKLGYEYLAQIGVNRFDRCKRCGALFRKNKNGTKAYCNDCATGMRPRVRRTICIDCGREMVVLSRNWRVCRCDNCQSTRNSKR